MKAGDLPMANADAGAVVSDAKSKVPYSIAGDHLRESAVYLRLPSYLSRAMAGAVSSQSW